MKRIFLLQILFLVSFTSSCQNNEVITYDSLKKGLANFLVKSEYIQDFDAYENNKEIINLRGVYNKIDKNSLVNGVYSFSINHSHGKAFFVIVDGMEYNILDITTKEGLYHSINNTLEFCYKQNYCKEIIVDYIDRLIGVYNINNNPNRYKNSDCEYELSRTKSTYTINQIKPKLVNFLVNENEIESYSHYIEYPEYFFLGTTGIYFGMPDETEFIDSGIYTFYNTEDLQQKSYYLMIDMDGYQILSVDNIKNLQKTIEQLLIFGEKNNYCYKETKNIILKIIDEYFSNSCLRDNTQKLP